MPRRRSPRMKAVILVVEAGADDRRILSRILASADYRAITAESAEAARLLIKTSPPDAALVERDLPGTGGIEFARELRHDAKTSRLPLLLLSVDARPQAQIQALREGAVNAYLIKPIDPQELLARLAALLAKRR